uniref:Uncharacterized protein n=1 Tax=Micrurus carvalhoi TaxID=3147026 RepID=A0A2H6N797_9SAUR
MASHSYITFTEAYLKIAQYVSGKNVLDLVAVSQKILRLAFQAQWESKWIGWNTHVGKIKLSDKECSFYFMILLSSETSVEKTKCCSLSFHFCSIPFIHLDDSVKQPGSHNKPES